MQVGYRRQYPDSQGRRRRDDSFCGRSKGVVRDELPDTLRLVRRAPGVRGRPGDHAGHDLPPARQGRARREVGRGGRRDAPLLRRAEGRGRPPPQGSGDKCYDRAIAAIKGTPVGDPGMGMEWRLVPIEGEEQPRPPSPRRRPPRPPSPSAPGRPAPATRRRRPRRVVAFEDTHVTRELHDVLTTRLATQAPRRAPARRDRVARPGRRHERRRAARDRRRRPGHRAAAARGGRRAPRLTARRSRARSTSCCRRACRGSARRTRCARCSRGAAVARGRARRARLTTHARPAACAAGRSRRSR